MAALKKVKIVLPYACTYEGPMPDTTFIKKVPGGWQAVHEFGTRTFKLGAGQKVSPIASAGGHPGIFPLFFSDTPGSMMVSAPNPSVTCDALESVGFNLAGKLRTFCGPQVVSLGELLDWQSGHCSLSWRGLQVIGIRIDGEMPVVPSVLATMLLASSRHIPGTDAGPFGAGRYMFVFVQEDAKGVSLALAYFGKPMLLSSAYFADYLIPRYLWTCYNLPHVATSVALHEIAVAGKLGCSLHQQVRGGSGFGTYLDNYPNMKDAFVRYRQSLLEHEYLKDIIDVTPPEAAPKKAPQAESEEESIHGL